MTPTNKIRVAGLMESRTNPDNVLRGLDDVIESEVETARAQEWIAESQSFQRLARGLHAQALLNADTLRGAFAGAFCEGAEITDVTHPLGSPLAKVDWPALVDWVMQQAGERGGWNVLPRSVSIRWAPDNRPVDDPVF